VQRRDLALGEQPARVPIDDPFQLPPDRVQIVRVENTVQMKVALIVEFIDLGLSKLHSLELLIRRLL
jgi:hypothetical protein